MERPAKYLRKEDGNEDSKIVMLDGVALPWKRWWAQPAQNEAEKGLVFVWCHGLCDHMENDGGSGWLEAIPAACEKLAQQEKLVLSSVVKYTARGHEGSLGWQGRGIAQFHWRCLGVDALMVAAAAGGSPRFLLGGDSMGAATAIWAAVLQPNAVAGLVLFEVPTMWETRVARRAGLEQRARDIEGSDPGKAELLMGAARADFPPKDAIENLNVPILILQARDDVVHPASSAEALAPLLPKASLVVVEKRAELRAAFTSNLENWLADNF